MTAHASLRRSPTEYAQALREPDVARSGGLAAVSGHSQVPGVAFVEVGMLSATGLHSWQDDWSCFERLLERWEAAGECMRFGSAAMMSGVIKDCLLCAGGRLEAGAE